MVVVDSCGDKLALASLLPMYIYQWSGFNRTN